MKRETMLRLIAETGYNGDVYINRFYGCAKYNIQDGKVTLVREYIHHTDPEWRKANARALYKERITDKKTA